MATPAEASKKTGFNLVPKSQPRTPQSPSILFCGKHRVSFVMFEPVYQLLRRIDPLWLGVSTGKYRRKPILGWLDPRERAHLNEVNFAEFDIDPSHLIKTGGRDPSHYDLYVTSNMDSRLQPKDCGVSVQIYHGVSFRNFAVNPEYTRFDKLFFPGRYMMSQYIARGILAEGDPRIELMGMPKVDRLVNGTLQRDHVLAELGLDPAVPTVLWCPTGANHNSFQLLGRAGAEAIQKAGYNLIIKLHDHPHLRGNQTPEDIEAEARAGLGERGRLAIGSDVTPLLAAADLLVSDASSVAYEYCLLDRPIVFVDCSRLLEKREEMEDSAMDTQSHGREMGRIASGTDQLVEVIGEELQAPGRLSAQRKSTAEDIFHDPGNATERMARRLCELAGIEPPWISP